MTTSQSWIGQEESLDAMSRCPRCHHVPEVQIENENVTLSCPQHGHMAMGASLGSAKAHWNQYISFVSKAA
jgi:hypothetical protein